MARVKLGDVAREYKATIKDTADLPIVGLEHLAPGEITLERWDVGTENTFTKGFKKGHMLFGRRRAYLKKAALAPFDGVCSGDITVIEAIPGKINPELLPFIIQNDLLFDYAVGNSAGSLSPRVKWESLKGYEFELPELAEQDGLVELLKAAHRTKKAYQKQIAATDELVKSQFIELFGSVENNKYGLPKLSIGSFASVKGGKRLPKGAEYSAVPTAHPYIRVVDLMDQTVNLDDLQYLDDTTQKAISRYIINKNDVYISIAGTIGQIGMVPECLDGANLTENAAKIVLNTDAPVLPEYLMWYLALPAGQQQIDSKTMHTTQPKLALFRIEEIEVLVPSFEQQRYFIDFAKQSDKSK